MSPRFKFRRLGLTAKIADAIFYPLMRIFMELNGTPDESPQETYRWNNRKFSQDDAWHLRTSMMVRVDADLSTQKGWFLRYVPMFHLPILGWQRYVVLRPKKWHGTWYVGWQSPEVTGYSQLPIQGSVRLLRGPGNVHFFGMDVCGQQIPIEEVGRSRLGDPKFQNLPLR